MTAVDYISGLRAKARAQVAEAPRREAGYTILNAAGDEGDSAVLRIYDEIWSLGVNALDLVADLDTITAPELRVEINSPGGDVFDGVAIYNALRQHPAKVTTRVDGIAASIASVIAQAGDRRVMVSGSQMMIHNAWALTVGDQRDHEQTASILDVQDEIIASIYATKSDKGADHFRDLMNAETWMTAERAVAEGLADEVLDPEEAPKASLIEKISAAVSAVDEALSSAEVVSAIRAEAGKELSNAVVQSLIELQAKCGPLPGLLPTPPATEEPANEDLERMYARVAVAREFSAALPPFPHRSKQ